MREILFRAKKIDSREWIEGYPMFVSKYNVWFIHTDNSTSIERYRVDSETLCQYTGVMDKRGQKIWENDIVSFWDTYSTENGQAETDCVGEVLWSDAELLFYVTNRISAESYEVLDDCVVIGNIFDDPELSGCN